MTGDLTPRAAESKNGTGADDGESTAISDINRLVYGPISQKLLDCILGHATQSLDEIPAEIVGIEDNPELEFDVLVEVECGERINVVSSRSLGQHGVEETEFHSAIPSDEGILTEISVEYQDSLFGFDIFVPCEE